MILKRILMNTLVLITGKLDYAKTSSQLKKDLKNLKENINLIGSIDKSKLKKDVQAAVSQVQVAPKIDTGALQKQIGKVKINPNVEGNGELQQMGNNLDSINKKSAATVASVGLLNQAFRTLQNTAKQMIHTAAELDQQLTELRMVTGQNYEDASRLVDSYNALAKELGATTSQVVDAADAWYALYIRVIQAAGIVNGVGGGLYDPEGLLTWGQTITILSRFVDQQECTLQHIQYNGWAEQAIQTAVANGWIKDRADFNPDAVIGRGELAQLINDVLALYR